MIVEHDLRAIDLCKLLKAKRSTVGVDWSIVETWPELGIGRYPSFIVSPCSRRNDFHELRNRCRARLGGPRGHFGCAQGDENVFRGARTEIYLSRRLPQVRVLPRSGGQYESQSCQLVSLRCVYISSVFDQSINRHGNDKHRLS